MPTCIDARVRKLGLKNTNATDLPASGCERSSPRLNFTADSNNRSSCSREKSMVLRKCIYQQLHVFLSQAQRWQQSQDLRVARGARNDLALEQFLMHGRCFVMEFNAKQ